MEYIEKPTEYQLTWKGWEWRTMDGKKWVWARKDVPGMKSQLFLDQRGIEDVQWLENEKTNSSQS